MKKDKNICGVCKEPMDTPDMGKIWKDKFLKRSTRDEFIEFNNNNKLLGLTPVCPGCYYKCVLINILKEK